ncbi:hypothetical protein MF271_23035 (plasmid) [Deinococcus sp. KNUC1210]|nr:hypothetical protein [Deinococcus sp. KNUC1210]ULH18336.1 hypothetical protein MF271_23035 [Deinococcus sp. KNUC1210]
MGQDDAGQGFALSSAITEVNNIAGPGLAGWPPRCSAGEPSSSWLP